ncbi:MAG: J domain-containing protein [Dehalococcoidia bacterium]
MTIRTSEPNYYQILGVEPSASAAAIKKAYRALMMRLHPDKNPDPAANEQAKLVNRAFEVVGNPQNRASYDGTRGVRRQPSSHRQPQPDTTAQTARDADRRMRQEEEARWRSQPEPNLAQTDATFIQGHWYAHPEKGSFQVVAIAGDRIRIRYRDGAYAKFLGGKLWSAWQAFLRSPNHRPADAGGRREAHDEQQSAPPREAIDAVQRARRAAERQARLRAEERRSRERAAQRRQEAEDRLRRSVETRRRNVDTQARVAKAQAKREAERRTREEAEQRARREVEQRERMEQERRREEAARTEHAQQVAAAKRRAPAMAKPAAQSNVDVAGAARRVAVAGDPHKAAQMLARSGWVTLIDKRSERGPLIVVPHDGHRSEVDLLFQDLKRAGVPLVYARGGGGVTEGQPAWLMR